MKEKKVRESEEEDAVKSGHMKQWLNASVKQDGQRRRHMAATWL